MVGGAGYAAGKRSQRAGDREAGQEERLETLEQQQAPAPAAPAPPAAAPAAGQDVVARLTELKGLPDAGALSQEEFDAAKRQVLGG